MSTTGTPSLKDQLDEKKNGFLANAEQQVIADYDSGVQDVITAGAVAAAKKEGDSYVDFELANATGTNVSLSGLLANGPVVLTWYRGGWCPYCNITLRALQLALPDFKATGATLVALTPELPDRSLSTSEKNNLEFEVLSDVENTVARQYGLVFKVPDYVNAHYIKHFNLDEFNGDDSHELPLAATYVIGTDGVIKYAFVDAEYRNRAEPADILAALNG